MFGTTDSNGKYLFDGLTGNNWEYWTFDDGVDFTSEQKGKGVVLSKELCGKESTPFPLFFICGKRTFRFYLGLQMPANPYEVFPSSVPQKLTRARRWLAIYWCFLMSIAAAVSVALAFFIPQLWLLEGVAALIVGGVAVVSSIYSLTQCKGAIRGLSLLVNTYIGSICCFMGAMWLFTNFVLMGFTGPG